MADTYLWKLQSVYAGSVVFNVGFGLYLYLSISSAYFLWKQPIRTAGRRVLLPYTLVMIGLNSSFFFMMSFRTELLSSSFTCTLMPSGDLKNSCHSFSDSYQKSSAVGTVLRTPSILLNDGIFIYRTFCIYRRDWRLLVLPCLLYTCMQILGMMDNILGGLGLDPGMTPYFTGFVTASIALNLLLTVMITYKLLTHRRMMLAVSTGSATALSASHLSTAVTLVVESATAWTFASLLYLITGVVGSPVSYFFEYLFHVTAQLSPAVLIFRVALKKHFVTPDEIQTYKCSPTSASFPLSGREHTDHQMNVHGHGGKAGNDDSASVLCESPLYTRPPQSMLATRSSTAYLVRTERCMT